MSGLPCEAEIWSGTQGVYQLRTKDEQTVYYVVQPDPRESDLVPANDGDREKVAAQVPMTG